MTVLLLLTFLALFVIGWAWLRDQIQATDSRLHWSAKQDRTEWDQQIAALTDRIRNLEHQLERVSSSMSVQPTASGKPASTQAAVPRTLPPEFVLEDPAPERRMQGSTPASKPISADGPENLPAWTESALTTPRQDESHSVPTGGERRDWETIVAGNLLNKLGALVLVIGIALFLGYAFTLTSPGGRSALATLVSVGLLFSGVVLERRPPYRVFSRGLLGAGWAALYTTAYAVYALPASQVIANPLVGSLLLLAVSAGMVAHSLRYRVQAITAVAFFSAFAALAVTPSTLLAVASLLPLLASLLYFAWRFEWYTMALFGLLSTYGVCLSHGDANAPLYMTTALLTTYWALFESFDILRSWKGTRSPGLSWIFPVNAAAFLALMERAWSVHAPQLLWQIAAGSAILFLISALIRPVRPSAAGGTFSEDPLACIRLGTYQAPLTLAALLAGLAILGHVAGFWANVFLAFEAELLYLLGVRWRSPFLRGLGCCGFLASLGDVFSTSSDHPGTMTILGHSLHNWTPSLIVYVSLFCLNRMLSRTACEFSFTASGLTVLVIVSEFAPRTASLALFLFALALFALGLQKQLKEFRTQSYLVALAALFLMVEGGGWKPYAPFSVYGYLGANALVCWLFTAIVLWADQSEMPEREAAGVRDTFAACGSAFALAALWMMLPSHWITIAWTGLGLAWLAGAFVAQVASFRWLAVGVMGIGYARLLGFNLSVGWAVQTSAERWLFPLLVIGALYLMWYVFQRACEESQRSIASIFTWLAAVAAVWLLELGTDRLFLTGAWALLGLVFLATGLRLSESALRWQSYCTMTLGVVACVLINFTERSDKELFIRVGSAALLIGCLFAVAFLLPRNADTLGAPERLVRPLSLLAAVLMIASLLAHEVSGGWLTVAWGLEAVACLGAGLPARETVLRWQGLAILGLCSLKLFLYDLRNLETVYRILSFIALGAILLGVSLIYTRFRHQIQRLL